MNIHLAKIPETPLQFLQLFFTDDIFDTLVEQTNLYFDQVKSSSNKNLTFQKTNQAEMKAYLGIVLAMGMGKLPSYEDYWDGNFLNMPWFSAVMSRNRSNNYQGIYILLTTPKHQLRAIQILQNFSNSAV